MDRSPQYLLDTDSDWEDGGANVELVEDGGVVGVYLEAGAIADGTRGAVATPEQAAAFAQAVLDRAAEAMHLRDARRSVRPSSHEVGR